MRAGEAGRLLAVTAAATEQVAARRDAAGTRLRLRALTAIGHPAVSLAGRLDVGPGTIRDIANGHTRTVSPALHSDIAALYDEMWDQPPAERTGAQRRAAAAARARAARNGWPPPMGLDDSQIDDPDYRPRAQWRPVASACLQPSARPHTAGHPRSRGRQENVRGHGHTGHGR
jgi:hypothetical protein